MGDVTGKVVIVTGAGRGIGRGISIAYARAGAKVVVTSRRKSMVDQVVDEIKREGGSAFGIACDVGERTQVFDMVDRAAKTFGAIDVLVNNAQSFAKANSTQPSSGTQPLETFDEEDWEAVYRTGLLATLWGMKAVFPHMKDRGGKIINFGSASGQMGLEGRAAYNATKEGVRALTRTAAREWGKYKINVNVINPGIVTEELMETYQSQPDMLKAMVNRPAGRWGEPIADAGGLAIFLASSASDYITGMTFMLDGGRYMTP